ncbi:MAG: GNAT family N-acetyltransferase [Betaproteobacteria bacterium]
MIEIRPACFPEDLEIVRLLFREYASSLDTDLCFQNFEEELASLPGKYQAPEGRLLIATSGDEAVGCVALRRIDVHSSEMKRLYVRPRARGESLGRRLVQRISAEAQRAGYTRICLDTLPSMTAAQALYQSLGFVAIEPYVFNPVAGTKFMALDLGDASARGN